jgi:hypothetical protein
VAKSKADQQFDALEALIHRGFDEGQDVGIKFNLASGGMWCGEIRITPSPCRKGGPDRSVVFFATGGNTPVDLVPRLLADVEAWRIDQSLGPFEHHPWPYW